VWFYFNADHCRIQHDPCNHTIAFKLSKDLGQQFAEKSLKCNYFLDNGRIAAYGEKNLFNKEQQVAIISRRQGKPS